MIELITLFILTTASVHYSLPEAEKLAREVIDAAQFEGHDPILFASLMKEESHWDPKAESPKGAYGIPQLNAAYFPPEAYPTRWDRLYKASKLLAEYNRVCGGTWRGMAAYRQGPKPCIVGGLKVGPATKRVFKLQRKWTARWRTLQKGATMQHGPTFAQAPN